MIQRRWPGLGRRSARPGPPSPKGGPNACRTAPQNGTSPLRLGADTGGGDHRRHSHLGGRRHHLDGHRSGGRLADLGAGHAGQRGVDVRGVPRGPHRALPGTDRDPDRRGGPDPQPHVYRASGPDGHRVLRHDDRQAAQPADRLQRNDAVVHRYGRGAAGRGGARIRQRRGVPVRAARLGTGDGASRGVFVDRAGLDARLAGARARRGPGQVVPDSRRCGAGRRLPGAGPVQRRRNLRAGGRDGARRPVRRRQPVASGRLGHLHRETCQRLGDGDAPAGHALAHGGGR